MFLVIYIFLSLIFVVIYPCCHLSLSLILINYPYQLSFPFTLVSYPCQLSFPLIPVPYPYLTLSFSFIFPVSFILLFHFCYPRCHLFSLLSSTFFFGILQKHFFRHFLIIGHVVNLSDSLAMRRCGDFSGSWYTISKV